VSTPKTLEIVVDSARDAMAAAAFADRIELCGELGLHGVTPEARVVREVAAGLRGIAAVARPRVVALVRPRHMVDRAAGEAFRADAADLAVMVREIEACIEAGADEVCVGVLDALGGLDVAACCALRRVDEARVVAFHRAFDWAAEVDPRGVVAALADLGFRRTLASGAAQLDVGGVPLISRVARLADAAWRARSCGLEIVTCGGVRPENAGIFVRVTGHVHASCRDGAGVFDAGIARGVREAI
jgi:copper homeostasis protein